MWSKEGWVERDNPFLQRTGCAPLHIDPLAPISARAQGRLTFSLLSWPSPSCSLECEELLPITPSTDQTSEKRPFNFHTKLTYNSSPRIPLANTWKAWGWLEDNMPFCPIHYHEHPTPKQNTLYLCQQGLKTQQGFSEFPSTTSPFLKSFLPLLKRHFHVISLLYERIT